MNEQTFVLEFEGIPKDVANKFAKELELLLKGVSRDAKIKTAQADVNTQDFGASIVIGILTTPAIVALCNKIGDWLVKKGSTISIKTKDGEIVAENIRSRDAAKLSEQWI